MLSRVAENLFWMSRYLERAENVARLLDIGLYLELDASSPAGEDDSAPVEIALGILSGGNVARPARPLVGPHRNAILGFLTFDRANPNSLLSTISLARENARGTQESSRRRRLERDQSPLPLSMRTARPAKVPCERLRALFQGQAVLHPLRRNDPEHVAARRSLSFHPPGPPSRARERHGPDPPHQVPNPSQGRCRHGRGHRAGSLDRAACEAARPTAPISASRETESSPPG